MWTGSQKKKKNHSLQGQIESIAKKTLVFPETKWLYQATCEYSICNAGSGSASLVLTGFGRGEKSFYLCPSPGLSSWASLAHDSGEELLSQSQPPQPPQAEYFPYGVSNWGSVAAAQTQGDAGPVRGGPCPASCSAGVNRAVPCRGDRRRRLPGGQPAGPAGASAVITTVGSVTADWSQIYQAKMDQ